MKPEEQPDEIDDEKVDHERKRLLPEQEARVISSRKVIEKAFVSAIDRAIKKAKYQVDITYNWEKQYDWEKQFSFGFGGYHFTCIEEFIHGGGEDYLRCRRQSIVVHDANPADDSKKQRVTIFLSEVINRQRSKIIDSDDNSADFIIMYGKQRIMQIVNQSGKGREPIEYAATNPEYIEDVLAFLEKFAAILDEWRTFESGRAGHAQIRTRTKAEVMKALKRF